MSLNWTTLHKSFILQIITLMLNNNNTLIAGRSQTILSTQRKSNCYSPYIKLNIYTTSSNISIISFLKYNIYWYNNIDS